MNKLLFRDPKYLAFAVHGGPVATTAGLTTSPDSGTTGLRVNHTTVKTGKSFESVYLTLPISALRGTDTGSVVQTVTLTLQHSTASGGTYVSFGSKDNAFTVGGASGSTVRGVASVGASLVGANPWVRGHVSYQAASADTAIDMLASAFTFTFLAPDKTPADS